MGGNVTALNKRSGVSVEAQKIDIKSIGRKQFMNKFIELFKFMNKEFKKKNKKPIWVDERHLANGFIFNGSTSYIMDPGYTDEEIIKYKPSAGDLDIIVPEHLKTELWEYLDSIEGKEVIPGVTYAGSNRPTISSISDQINSVFIVEFSNGVRAHAQVDFEFLEFENDSPTEWAKFSHSSSFADAKAGVKAVHHKLLIRALVGGASVRDDIVIATPKSTYDKVTLTKSKIHAIPRMLKFSVSRGIRLAYEPLINPLTNEVVVIDGKQVYKEIKSADSSYENVVANIYKLAFKQLHGNESDVKLFNSFIGVLELMKKYLSKKQIDETHKRYIDLLWASKGLRGQELERDDPDLDYQVKISGYSKFIEYLHLDNKSIKMVDEYYSSYGRKRVRESFRDLLDALRNEI